MLTRDRTVAGRGLALGMILCAALAPAALGDDPPADATSPPASPANRGFDPIRRVPPFFGQVGLSPEQKETIYKIRAQRQAKIAALQKQIADLQAEEMKECEAVLTQDQRRLLDQRRRGVREPSQRISAARAAGSR